MRSQDTNSVLQRVRQDYERFAGCGPVNDLPAYLLETYDIDLRTEYAGVPIVMPFGKASGQLSMTLQQVADDLEAGLGFVVLKTVIAEDGRGERSMREWANKESRMVVERIRSASGAAGWTVSWKGRGWWQPFADYLRLVQEAREISQGGSTLIVPSCKYHLPAHDDEPWRIAEYEHTTRAILDAWIADPATDGPMPIEKDFSPTLAGSDRSQAKDRILEWLAMTPALMREAAPLGALRVGLKLFNALFDDGFQIEMLESIHRAEERRRPDFLVYGNRLFDPAREFEGQRGIAYGGPDLSDRNLRVMEQFGSLARDQEITPIPWCATGNIVSGRIALDYALLGASSFQLHTFFQLPLSEYAMKTGSRSQRTLHELLFHPFQGLIAAMIEEAARREFPRQPLRLRDFIGKGRCPCAPG